MLSISTDAWPARDRVERWREEFGRSVIRADVASAVVDTARFGVNLRLLTGDAGIDSTRMLLRGVRKVRDRPWCRDGVDTLTLMLCVAGTVRFETAGTQRLLRRGEAALFSHAVPVVLEWADTSIVTLQLPRESVAAVADPERLAGRVTDRRDPAALMLRAYLAELWRQGEPISERAGRHLVDLARECVTGSPAHPSPARHGSAPRLAALRAMIRARADADCQLADLCRALGISRRTAERTFAAAGTSFADELVETRLQRALEWLRAPGAARARISEIAFRTGFADLSHFNRRFRARFGVTPSEARVSAGPNERA